MKFDEAIEKCTTFDKRYEDNTNLRRELEQKLQEINDRTPINPHRALRSVVPVGAKWRLSIYVGLSPEEPRNCYEFCNLYEKVDDVWEVADAVTALCKVTNTERDAIVSVMFLIKEWKQNKIDWPWPLLNEDEVYENLR